MYLRFNSRGKQCVLSNRNQQGTLCLNNPGFGSRTLVHSSQTILSKKSLGRSNGRWTSNCPKSVGSLLFYLYTALYYFRKWQTNGSIRTKWLADTLRYRQDNEPERFCVHHKLHHLFWPRLSPWVFQPLKSNNWNNTRTWTPNYSETIPISCGLWTVFYCNISISVHTPTLPNKKLCKYQRKTFEGLLKNEITPGRRLKIIMSLWLCWMFARPLHHVQLWVQPIGYVFLKILPNDNKQPIRIELR